MLAGEDVFDRFRKLSRLNPDSCGQRVILTDENTRVHCLPLLLERMPELENAMVLVIPAGEQEKTLAGATRIWMELNAAGAGGSTQIICLGGGMVTDLGGFAAAAYHRGLPLTLIPTSLIGQLDAAIGGKTAVNLENLKNQVGFFHVPDFVLIYPPFLNTLPRGHLRSGIAEMVKSYLLGNPESWRRIKKLNVEQLLADVPDDLGWRKWVLPAIKYKVSVVRRDFHEHNLRKALNFGHTLGHAFETLSLGRTSGPLTHGEAVAAGILCESWLSALKTGLAAIHLEEISAFLKKGFPLFDLNAEDIPKILQYLRSDKKNRNGRTAFSLLEKPGKPVINVTCTPDEITDALNYYRKTLNSAT